MALTSGNISIRWSDWDEYPVRTGLGNLKDENFKMVFWYHKDDSIIHKEIGQGYISINDVLLMVMNLHVDSLGSRKKIHRDLR